MLRGLAVEHLMAAAEMGFLHQEQRNSKETDWGKPSAINHPKSKGGYKASPNGRLSIWV